MARGSSPPPSGFKKLKSRVSTYFLRNTDHTSSERGSGHQPLSYRSTQSTTTLNPRGRPITRTDPERGPPPSAPRDTQLTSQTSRYSQHQDLPIPRPASPPSNRSSIHVPSHVSAPRNPILTEFRTRLPIQPLFATTRVRVCYIYSTDTKESFKQRIIDEMKEPGENWTRFGMRIIWNQGDRGVSMLVRGEEEWGRARELLEIRGWADMVVLDWIDVGGEEGGGGGSETGTVVVHPGKRNEEFAADGVYELSAEEPRGVGRYAFPTESGSQAAHELSTGEQGREGNQASQPEFAAQGTFDVRAGQTSRGRHGAFSSGLGPWERHQLTFEEQRRVDYDPFRQSFGTHGRYEFEKDDS